MHNVNPMALLKESRQAARENNDPSSKYCTLATLDQDAPNQPRTRTLVVRQISDQSCLLFVNRHAQKNLSSLESAKVELLFFYPSLMAQYRMRGELTIMSPSELEPHWQHKPYGSKLLDHFYQSYQAQSSELKERAELEKGIAELEIKYPDTNRVPFTEDALGLVITANYLEVWQGRDDGIHDRRLFTLHSEHWQEAALVP